MLFFICVTAVVSCLALFPLSADKVEHVCLCLRQLLPHTTHLNNPSGSRKLIQSHFFKRPTATDRCHTHRSPSPRPAPPIRHPKRYRIHYPGWDSNWDEWVVRDRLRWPVDPSYLSTVFKVRDVVEVWCTGTHVKGAWLQARVRQVIYMFIGMQCTKDGQRGSWRVAGAEGAACAPVVWWCMVVCEEVRKTFGVFGRRW